MDDRLVTFEELRRALFVGEITDDEFYALAQAIGYHALGVDSTRMLN